jgi:hypothetical protein
LGKEKDGNEDDDCGGGGGNDDDDDDDDDRDLYECERMELGDFHLRIDKKHR